jgi:cbb3-type cytochrome oxidase maturation protein
MDILLYLIPAALGLGGLWLAGFMWALKNGQFDDPEGSAARILLDDDEVRSGTSGPQPISDK